MKEGNVQCPHPPHNSASKCLCLKMKESGPMHVPSPEPSDFEMKMAVKGYHPHETVAVLLVLNFYVKGASTSLLP